MAKQWRSPSTLPRPEKTTDEIIATVVDIIADTNIPPKYMRILGEAMLHMRKLQKQNKQSVNDSQSNPILTDRTRA